MDAPPPGDCHTLLVRTRRQLETQARRAGYLEPAAWQAVLTRLAALGASPADLAELRDSLARAAAADGWVFPEEPPPGDQRRRRDLLVARARAQARRVPVITHAYLSALLRLALAWGLAHETVASDIAACAVAERWSVDWELACGMEGLLGAEQAAERRRTAWEQTRVQFERRGRKGWLSQRELNHLYAGLRERGIPDAEARALWEELHAAADARGWAWAGSRPQPQLIAACLRVLRSCWRCILDRLDTPAVLERWRVLAPSGLRVGPPILALMVVLESAQPAAVARPVASAPPAVAVAVAAATLAPVPTVVPRPTAAPAPVAVQPLTLVVAHTDGVGARLRTAPVTGPVARLLDEGTTVVEIGSELDINGTGWRQVRAPDGTRGWMAAELLQPADSRTPPHPTG